VQEEPIIPLPAPRAQIPIATRFRSTWIVSSLQSLRAAGHVERYLASLPLQYHEEILSSVAGVWLPLAMARAHYEACESLGLSLDDQLTMGRSVGGRAQGTLLMTVVKAARGAGVTPWTIMPQFHRLWVRGVEGGAAAVYRLGPKDARADFVRCELLDIPYFRNGLRGILLGSSTLFCTKAYIQELPNRRPGDVSFRMQWV
jgi:hypothetical protein